MYCRYREVSPICVGKHRPLRTDEITKEHLIPRFLMKDPKFRAKWGIAFNPSDEPNVDISCHKCNHLKNQMADVPFVWKLQYFNKYGIVIKTKRSLARSIRFQEDMTLTVKERDTALQCILRGDFEWLEHRVARFNFRQVSVDLSDGVVVHYLDARRKLPRKIKKKSL